MPVHGRSRRERQRRAGGERCFWHVSPARTFVPVAPRGRHCLPLRAELWNRYSHGAGSSLWRFCLHCQVANGRTSQCRERVSLTVRTQLVSLGANGEQMFSAGKGELVSLLGGRLTMSPALEGAARFQKQKVREWEGTRKNEDSLTFSRAACALLVCQLRLMPRGWELKRKGKAHTWADDK